MISENSEQPIESFTVEIPSSSSKQMSDADRETLKIIFNKAFDDTIQKYLTETCGYENTDNIEKLREKLDKKFVVESKGATIKGEERVIKPYLKSLMAVFECLYKRYKSGSFLPNPALLYKRIDRLIADISSGSIKKINNVEKEKLCADVIENIKGGSIKGGSLRSRSVKGVKQTRRRKTRRRKTRKSRKSRRRNK